MSKYIIDVGEGYIQHGLERTLAILVKINDYGNHWMDTRIPVTPYTEPDTEKIRKEAYEKGKRDIYAEDIKTINTLKKEVDGAYQRGYETAKHKCNIQSEKDMREVGERHYQKGLSDAWDAARKILRYGETGGKLEVLTDVFSNVDGWWDIINRYTAAEAIEKLKAYEQEQDGLRQNIQTIVDQCGYTLDEIAAVLEKMQGEKDG